MITGNHRRPYVVSVRLSRAEQDALTKRMQESGAKTKAEYIRRRLLT